MDIKVSGGKEQPKPPQQTRRIRAGYDWENGRPIYRDVPLRTAEPQPDPIIQITGRLLHETEDEFI